MTTISRSVEFDAGHRIQRHESKCRNLHGHRYRVVVEVSADELDAVGRVVDFGVIKSRVGGWIDREWDHALLLDLADTDATAAIRTLEGKVFHLPGPPTAEVMAEFLYGLSVDLLADAGVMVRRVTVWETPNCSATYGDSA